MNRAFLLAAATMLGTPALGQTASPAAGDRTVDGSLLSLECGDNCWLTYLAADGQVGTALCQAPDCGSWMLEGSLPERLVRQPVRLTLQMGQAISGDVVMAEAEAAVGVELLEPSLAKQPFGSGGIWQGMTRAEVAAAAGAAVAPNAREAELAIDERTYRVAFCDDRVHALTAVAADGAEWLSALDWLHAQGFALGQPVLTSGSGGEGERRELVQALASPEAPYRVEARMVALSSPESSAVSYDIAYLPLSPCSAQP